MAPLPTIAGCFRVTWNFAQYLGITPRIVQHYLAADSTAEELGQAIWEEMVNGFWEPMHASFEPQSLDVIKLDGTSASVNVPRAGFFTGTTCEGSGQIVPQAAAVMSLKTNVRGPRGRGRSYVGPVVESMISDGVIDDTPLDDMYGAWQTTLGALALRDPVIALAVASYVHEEAHPVTSVVPRKLLGTQRRRQDQLR